MLISAVSIKQNILTKENSILKSVCPFLVSFIFPTPQTLGLESCSYITTSSTSCYYNSAYTTGILDFQYWQSTDSSIRTSRYIMRSDIHCQC